MKTIFSFLIAGWLISGCVAGGNVSHEDSPAATKRDEGPCCAGTDRLRRVTTGASRSARPTPPNGWQWRRCDCVLPYFVILIGI